MHGKRSDNTRRVEASCRRARRWLESVCAAAVCMSAQMVCAQLLPPVADDWARGGLTVVEGWTFASNNAGRVSFTGGESLDPFGASGSAYGTSSFFRGNTYKATGGFSTLLGHEFYLTRSIPVQIAFCVYESAATNGPFALIDQVTVYAPSGSGFISSGQRGVPLRSGKFYAIGAAITETATYQRLTALSLPIECGNLTCVKGVGADSLPADTVTSFTTYSSPHRQRLRLAGGYDEVPDKFTSTSDSSATGYMKGNLYTATSNTWLLGHGLYVPRSATKTINLFVYESAIRTGTYTRVDLQSVTAPAATNFVSASTQIPLTAGHFYLIGGHCSASFSYEFANGFYDAPYGFDWGQAIEGFSSSQPSGPPATVIKAAATNQNVYSACVMVGDRPAVRMDTSAVSMSTNSMTVVVASAGYSDLTLAFDHRESGDDTQAGDGVFVSANGTTFTNVLAIEGTTTAWKHYETNIIALAEAAGVSTSSNLYIRLQQQDDYPWPTDGREFANIRVFAKPDLAWQALDATHASYLFRGSVAKTFNLSGTVRLAGGTNDVVAQDVSVRHRLYDFQGVVQTSTGSFTADVPALGHRQAPFDFSLTVPAGTILTQSYYWVDATLDSAGALAEGRENNNATWPDFLVNHYSGTLRFSNTAATVTLTSWGFQPNFGAPIYSPVRHLITGTGSLADRTFAFTNLMVRKQLSTGDYEIDPDETQFFALPGLSGTTGTIAGVQFLYDSDIHLSRQGVRAFVSVFLPAGCAFVTDPESPWGVAHVKSSSPVSLDANLSPTGTVSIALDGQRRYFFEESKPLYFETSTLLWNTSGGSFAIIPSSVVYAHDGAMDALDALASGGQISLAAAVRRSNDGYYRSAFGSPYFLLLTRDAQGAAQISCIVALAASSFRTHFPYDVALAWDAASGLMIDNDLPADSQASSRLISGRDFSVPYTTGCPGGCAGADNSRPLDCQNVADAFYFTSDGGLFVPCAFSNGTADLRWGYLPSKNDYAQRAYGFSEGVLHVPGHFLRADDCPAALTDDDMPGALLLTAVGGAGDELTRPFEAGYTRGDGNPAGVTVQWQDASCLGKTLVGGKQVLGPYPLDQSCKLYVRSSGISGVHVADSSFGSQTVPIYGYPFRLDCLAFSYLSLVNKGSFTSGKLTVPAPSAFEINFAELRLNCLGDVESAVPSTALTTLDLAYWSARVAPASLQFASTNACSVGDKTLLMDVTLNVASIPEPLFGRLGVLSNGNLSAASDLNVGCDSRLTLPRTVTLPGPGTSHYTLRPVGKAYFNDYRHKGDLYEIGDGMLTFAGELDVPFFENLLVQAFTSAQSSGPPLTYLVGGWPTEGWKIGGQTPFTSAAFDATNAGHPTNNAAPSFSDYIAGNDSAYIPHARREWMAGIGFDIGVRWDSATRSFRSPAPKTSDLIVLQTEYNVPQLNAERAEITFGMQYGELPALNLSSAMFNAVDATTGISERLTSVVGSAVTDALDDGVATLNKLTSTDPTVLLGSTLSDQVNPFVNTLYSALTNAYATGSSVTNVIVGYIRTGEGVQKDTLKTLLGNIVEGTESVGKGLGLAEDLQDKIDDALAMIDAVAAPQLGSVSLLQKVDGEYPLLKALANVLLLFAMPALDEGNSALTQKINDIMDGLTPTLDTVRETLLEVRSQLEDTRAALADNGEFRNELKDLVNNNAAQIDALAATVADRLVTEITALDGAFSPRTNYTPEEIKALLRTTITDALREAVPIGQLQRVVRARMLDVDRQIRGGVDSVMGQVNQAMRDALSEVVGSLDTSVSGMSSALADVLGTGQIEGYAHIQGDSLDKLRLDLAMQLKVPEEMQFAGFLEINNEQTTASGGCAFKEGSTYKVTLGAKDVACNWLGSAMRINCDCFFTLNDGKPKGMGGGIELVGGSLKFETLEVERFGAAVAFGALENYLAASARLVMNGSVEIEGGLFFGRTCTLAPLKLVDANVGDLLGQPPFTGAYVYGEGWVPIYDYGCAFRIKAGAGFGVFYFAEGPTYGIRILLGASGEALCVVTVRGTVELYALKQGDTFRARGKGKIKGKAGSCPFCVKFGKTVTITYDDGEWDADY